MSSNKRPRSPTRSKKKEQEDQIAQLISANTTMAEKHEQLMKINERLLKEMARLHGQNGEDGIGQVRLPPTARARSDGVTEPAAQKPAENGPKLNPEPQRTSKQPAVLIPPGDVPPEGDSSKPQTLGRGAFEHGRIGESQKSKHQSISISQCTGVSKSDCPHEGERVKNERRN